MDCQWVPFENKWKCQNCGFIVPDSTFKKNCIIKQDIPNIIQRGKNLGKAMVKHVREGMKNCSDNQKQVRFEICESNKCGLFRGRGEGGICAHEDCGCYLRSNGRFMDKLSWAESKCPIGLWLPVESK